MTTTVLRAWPPLPPTAWLRRPDSRPPFPLGDPGCGWFARGRHALWHGARALGLGPGDELLAPAYHHGSEIEALARLGVHCRFYAADERLAPDAAELDALLGPCVRGLLLIHYLGFPQDAARWRAWCDARGLLLLEDAAQAWLATDDGRPVGARGDLAVFCTYKFVGVPDGALLYLRAPGAGGAARTPQGAAAPTLARRHAAWLAARSPAAALLWRAVQRPVAYDPAADFALGDPDAAPTGVAARLAPRIAGEAVAAGRRARYAVLLDALGAQVPAPFERLPDGAAPFAFPLDVEAKAETQARLAAAGVQALDFWSQGHPSLPAAAFPAAAARRARTLALPVHQELRAADVERVAAALAPRRRPPELRLEPLGPPQAARAEWTALAAQVGDPFATWEWAVTWCRHLLGGRPLHVVACRDAVGRLAGILPLYEAAARPLRLLRFLGSGPADRQGPICLPTDRAAVGRALRRALDRELRCDLLLAERLPGEAAWSARLGGRMLRREASPALALGGRSFDELLRSRSANFRQQVRARERRLATRFALRFRLADDPDRLPADLATLRALHAARWGADGSDAFAGTRAAFHAEFAERALDAGWLRLWFLELDGRPVAAWHGFRYGDADWFYQAGRDPAHDRDAVGFVLMAHALREAAADGVAAFHLLRGDEPYKARFAGADAGLETVAVGRAAPGRAAAGTAALALALPARGRRVIARLARA